MSEPEVRSFLTVSASHLPQDFPDRLDDQARNGRGFQDREFGFWPFAGEYGYLIYAPDGLPHEVKDEFNHRGMPESVTSLLAYARHELGCSFVLFDVEGDVVDGFETYEEPANIG
jgi:hypothetical protein